MARVAEDADHPRRDQDEERAQRRQAEQHQPEEARRDAPRALRVLLQQVDEDGHERGRQRRVGDERAHEVRQLERDRERVDLPRGAEVVRRDHFAHEPEHAREPGRRGEDRGRDAEPPLGGRRPPARLAGSAANSRLGGTIAGSGRSSKLTSASLRARVAGGRARAGAARARGRRRSRPGGYVSRRSDDPCRCASLARGAVALDARRSSRSRSRRSAAAVAVQRRRPRACRPWAEFPPAQASPAACYHPAAR